MWKAFISQSLLCSLFLSYTALDTPYYDILPMLVQDHWSQMTMTWTHWIIGKNQTCLAVLFCFFVYLPHGQRSNTILHMHLFCLFSLTLISVKSYSVSIIFIISPILVALGFPLFEGPLAESGICLLLHVVCKALGARYFLPKNVFFCECKILIWCIINFHLGQYILFISHGSFSLIHISIRSVIFNFQKYEGVIPFRSTNKMIWTIWEQNEVCGEWETFKSSIYIKLRRKWRTFRH